MSDRDVAEFEQCTEEQENEVPITTRAGDRGTSSLYNGKRLPKSDIHFEALGNIDECNSYIGVCREFLTDDCKEVDTQLERIQCILFDVNAAIATPLKTSKERALNKTTFNGAFIEELEAWTAKMYKELPPQNSFLLPSGGKAATFLHVARSICRRAERSLVPLLQDEDISEDVYKFVNRLSDCLYYAARFVAMKEGKEEKKWFKVN